MPKHLRAVFFDVDGVLVNSLPQHLQICRDKAREYGLEIEIPTANAFRQLVSSGISVSPMLNFFLSVGFPAPAARRAVADYERDFARLYRPSLFRGVETTLASLSEAGLTLGLVTANARQNVEPILGRTMRHFHEDCVHYLNDSRREVTKATALGDSAALLRFRPSSCVYVGDQPADAAAAREAGYRFLGVTYGWGLMPGSVRDSVRSLSELKERLLGLAMAA